MESISCLLKAILNKHKYLIFDQLSGFLKGMVLPALLLTTGFLQAQQIEKKPPNILVIVLDDARYDMFQPNGGPAFFNTPGINSIAKEGANFQFTGATTSLCCPSRASIYTGLYAHHHGTFLNTSSPKAGLTYVSKVLQDAGYYTGFIGKWLYNYQIPDTPIGFDYWAVTDSFNHKNPVIKFNDGTTLAETKNDALVFTDLALDFLKNRKPFLTPWLLFVSHRVPHDPYSPLPEHKTLYQDVDIPFPDNFYKYENNFPNYLYPGSEYEGDSAALDQDIRDYYETCLASEVSTDSILNYLKAAHLLESTLVIFISDNGYLFGEHKLVKKQLSNNESIRIPLFIRYPAWFKAGTVIDNEYAANIDIAPTLLEAAGIPDTFHMDGISLHKLATGEQHRKYFFYEKYPETGTCWDGVFSFKYKYIYSYCNSMTEEFFDLTLDPKENTNLIFDTTYASIIQEYRVKLDSLRLATGNTMHPPLTNCHLDFYSYEDFDKDDFGNPEVSNLSDKLKGGYVLNRDDCNDSLKFVNPAAADICNDVDDNCNSVIDENAIVATIEPFGSITICSNSSVVLTATNGGDGIVYQWKKNGSNISGETQQTYIAKKAGDYTLKESNDFDCSSISAIATVNLVTAPDAVITALGDLDICISHSVELQANAGPDFCYQWQKGSNFILGATNQLYAATTTGNYKVTVTSGGICSKKSSGKKVTSSCKNNASLLSGSASSFLIFPNPSAGNITVVLEFGNEVNDLANITIENAVGQIVFSENAPLSNGKLIKNISLNRSWADGVYFVKICINNHNLYEKLNYTKSW